MTKQTVDKVKTIFVFVSLTKIQKKKIHTDKMSEIKKQLRLVPTTALLAQVKIQTRKMGRGQIKKRKKEK